MDPPEKHVKIKVLYFTCLVPEIRDSRALPAKLRIATISSMFLNTDNIYASLNVFLQYC